VLAVAVGWTTACAYSPSLRPVGPPMGNRAFEAGLGAVGIVGQDRGGVGASGWVTGRVAPDVLLVGRGHVAEAVPWDAEGGRLGQQRGRQWGGAAGLRGLFTLRPGLLAGGELLLDYTQFSATDGAATSTSTQHFVSVVASFPVAEEAFPGVYAYVQPALGAGYRLGDVDVPFGGFFELPLGFAWQAQPGVLLLAEGGLSVPFSAGYVALGAACRF